MAKDRLPRVNQTWAAMMPPTSATFGLAMTSRIRPVRRRALTTAGRGEPGLIRARGRVVLERRGVLRAIRVGVAQRPPTQPVRDADAPILVEVDRDQAREQADGLGDDELDEDQSDEGDERMRGQRL